jgi:hypothetical protein
MTLTWTFYPKHERESVTLTVVYTPELDAKKLSGGGFLVVNTNTAYVDWATYKRFDSGDVENRKDAFKQLVTIDQDMMEPNQPEYIRRLLPE